jgi:hypothetical protein
MTEINREDDPGLLKSLNRLKLNAFFHDRLEHVAIPYIGHHL